MQRVQLQTSDLVETSDQLEEVFLQRVQLQTNHPVERSARRSYLVDSSVTKKPPCREFSYKLVTLQIHQLEEVTLQRVQLQRNHSVKSSAANKSPIQNSATNKSPCREISQKKLPCRQFSYKQIILLQRDQLEEVTLQIVHLQTIHPVQSSVRRGFLVDRSATNNSPCREISQKKLPCRVFSYKEITMESSVINICITYIKCTFTDKIRNIQSIQNLFHLFSSSCGKEKKIGKKNLKAGHRPALGYTNTKRSEI